MDADTVCILARNKDKTLRFRISPDGLTVLIDHLIVRGAAAMQDKDTGCTCRRGARRHAPDGGRRPFQATGGTRPCSGQSIAA
ncbi:hypothetical protein [Arthrobacter sp. MA-N2]|uniref:hypothetical protein n=1 Tax=Arthrobacter sp. MA-N2 TaxID=1101188 RepID=UPI0004892C20|nr:hypothetical protein [Arthrobacter sp. MA-N2]